MLAPAMLYIQRGLVGLFAHESILRNLGVVTTRKQKKKLGNCFGNLHHRSPKSRTISKGWSHQPMSMIGEAKKVLEGHIRIFRTLVLFFKSLFELTIFIHVV